MKIIHRHYSQWFDRVYDPRDASMLTKASQSALSEVAELKTRLMR